MANISKKIEDIATFVVIFIIRLLSIAATVGIFYLFYWLTFKHGDSTLIGKCIITLCIVSFLRLKYLEIKSFKWLLFYVIGVMIYITRITLPLMMLLTIIFCGVVPGDIFIVMIIVLLFLIHNKMKKIYEARFDTSYLTFLTRYKWRDTVI